jgi:LysM repeat protein
LATFHSCHRDAPTSVFHHFTTSPLHHFTTSPLHHFTTSPLHHFTTSPLHLKPNIHTMTSIRILAASLLALAFVSCAAQKSSDTTDQFGTAAGGPVNTPVTQPVNPVYDTPAAYEETGAAAAAAPVVAAAGAVSQPNIPAAAAPKPATNGAAIIHTVVAGDTLSGISSKYKVSAAAIKQANGMTKDTVVLGKKMVIPPAH